MTRPIGIADREAAKAALEVDDERLDQLNVLTDDDGGFADYGVGGTIARMGAVIPRLSRPEDYWNLALGVVEATQTAGHTRGKFAVHEPTMLRLIEDTFEVKSVVEGVDENGIPASWSIVVDLADAERQLRTQLGTVLHG